MLTLLALFFLIVSFCFGFSLGKFFMITKTKSEHLIYALPLGILFLTYLIFFSSLIVGFNRFAIFFVILLSLGISFLMKPKVKLNLEILRWFIILKRNLLIIPPLILFSVYFAKIWSKMYFFKDGDLYASFVHAWGDLPIHLSFTNSFLFASNFPPHLPLLSQHLAAYHFMADFFSAILLKLNVDLLTVLNFPGFIFSVSLVLLVFLLAKEITKNNLASVLSVFLFFFGGGLGFIYWRKTSGFIEYTQLHEKNIYFANIIPSILIPQKASLFGLVISLIVFIILQKNLDRLNFKSIFFASSLVALMPLTYIHGFFASLVFLSFFYLYFFLKTLKNTGWQGWQILKLTLAFLLPILFLAIPQLIYFYPQVLKRAAGLSFWHFWWCKPPEENPFIFYFKNFGVFLLLLPISLIKAKKKQVLFYLPALFLFALSNIMLFQPGEFENFKMIYYWYLASCFFVARLIADLLKRNFMTAFLGVVLLILTTLSGFLDTMNLLDYQKYKVRVFEKKHFQIADWINKNLEPKAVFLTAPQHDHPVSSLAGRPIFLGFEGWLANYGIETSQRKGELKKIYQGIQAKELLKKNKIDYVFIGPGERNLSYINETYFRQNFKLVYSNYGVLIFKVF
ncbi:MAG TPA: hypothetical protein VMW29_02490 [Candidatus Bathyarchaeia archaeon]|nr:hypothetical protein [Candidatus Bathyarchaeia archaeon]